MANDIVVLQGIIVVLVWAGTLIGAFLYGRHFQRGKSEGLTKDQILDKDKATVAQLLEARKAELIEELTKLGVNVPK